MNREEAIKELTELLPEEFLSEYAGAIKMGIEALEKEPCEVSQGLVKDSQGFSQEPCDDAISRSATLDAIIKRLGIKNETYLLEAERVIYQQILAMPSVTPQHNKWIPCSERLPEKNIRCLVAVGRFNYTQIATYSDLMGTIDHRIFYRGDYGHENFENITQYVKAWMPLPKPYKPEIPTDQIVANGELYPGEFDLAEEGSEE